MIVWGSVVLCIRKLVVASRMVVQSGIIVKRQRILDIMSTWLRGRGLHGKREACVAISSFVFICSAAGQVLRFKIGDRHSSWVQTGFSGPRAKHEPEMIIDEVFLPLIVVTGSSTRTGTGEVGREQIEAAGRSSRKETADNPRIHKNKRLVPSVWFKLRRVVYKRRSTHMIPNILENCLSEVRLPIAFFVLGSKQYHDAFFHCWSNASLGESGGSEEVRLTDGRETSFGGPKGGICI